MNVSFARTNVECCLWPARNRTGSVSLLVKPRLELFDFSLDEQSTQLILALLNQSSLNAFALTNKANRRLTQYPSNYQTKREMFLNNFLKEHQLTSVTHYSQESFPALYVLKNTSHAPLKVLLFTAICETGGLYVSKTNETTTDPSFSIEMISAYLTKTKCLDMFALFIQLAKNALIKAEHPSSQDILSKLSAQEKSITQQELKELIEDLF